MGIPVSQRVPCGPSAGAGWLAQIFHDFKRADRRAVIIWAIPLAG